MLLSQIFNFKNIPPYFSLHGEVSSILNEVQLLYRKKKQTVQTFTVRKK